MNTKVEILGVGFDSLSREELKIQLNSMLTRGEQGYIVTPNPEILMCAEKDAEYRGIINHAALCIADGVGVIWASKILRAPIRERIPGVEMGEEILAMCAREGRGVFFLGGKQGVAEAAAEKMKAKYPGLVISGTHHGYFDNSENDRIVEHINNSRAQVLFVCMGFPYQEKWIADNLRLLSQVKLAFALGGSLDVYSGNVKRAPRLLCRVGLEWLWRAFSSTDHFVRVLKLPSFILRVFRARSREKKQQT